MPVRKLPSGRWQARVWDADRGTHVGIGTYATEKEARKAEARHEAGMEEPKPEQPKQVVRGRQKFGQYALEIPEARKHTLKPGDVAQLCMEPEDAPGDVPQVAVA